MVYVQKTFNILSLFFFIPLVFIGAFFLLNLTLVVIKSKFTEEHEANKERKRKRKFILKKITKEELAKIAEAKLAFKKIKVKNRKIYESKLQRRDSDNSKAESRHRKNMEKIQHDDLFILQHKAPKPDSRVMTAKTNGRGTVNMRPLHGISGLNKKKDKNAVVGDPITEEMSNSDLSIAHPHNIFYPSNLSANGNDTKAGVTKERNILYLKKGTGKIKMEGMYGISRMHDLNGNNELSQSDLLEEIPFSNNDDDIDNGDENVVGLPDSEIMFPLDSSLSDSSKYDKRKTASKSKAGNNGNDKEGTEKEHFCISESSYEFEDDESRLSPEKLKNNVDRKNTNYFTATNLSSLDVNDLKSGAKKSGNKESVINKNGKEDEAPTAKVLKGKSTKISSRIEGDSNFKTSVGDPLAKTMNSLGAIKDFNIKNILFTHFQKKKTEIEDDLKKDFNTEGEGADAETDEKKDGEIDIKKGKKKKKKEQPEVKLEDMHPDDIVVLKRGLKVKLRRDLKFNDKHDTPYEDVLVKVEEHEEKKHDHKHKEEEKEPKTTMTPYTIRRYMEMNEYLLEGKVEEEEEEKEEKEKGESKKVEESKSFNRSKKSEKEEEESAEESKNLYLEKFKYFYRSNIISTGTISLVLTIKNKEAFNIPNP